MACSKLAAHYLEVSNPFYDYLKDSNCVVLIITQIIYNNITGRVAGVEKAEAKRR